MPSLREERLQERVAEIRPQLAKAREIAEKAEAENRAMTPEEQKALRRDHGQGSRGRRCGEATPPRQSVFAFARELSDNVVGGLSDGTVSLSGSPGKSRRLSFKGMGAKVAAQMMPDGMKALAPQCRHRYRRQTT
ncbi:MAG TPA: hypothetical protein VN888_08645 [Mycobacterium sp.]|jgi:hypothetical protein|nr:hypothetical protein [Mycobacterium sp.]